VPLVPELPLEPLDPELPLEPLDPELPLEPFDPELPLEPLDPELPPGVDVLASLQAVAREPPVPRKTTVNLRNAFRETCMGPPQAWTF